MSEVPGYFKSQNTEYRNSLLKKRRQYIYRQNYCHLRSKYYRALLRQKEELNMTKTDFNIPTINIEYLYDSLGPILSVLKDGNIQDFESGFARCPVCDDREGFFCVYVTADGRIEYICDAECSSDDIIAGVNLQISECDKISGIELYDYKDENGKILFQRVITKDDGFFLRRPDGAGGWTIDLERIEPIPYRLPELVKAPIDENVYIVDSEDDADVLASHGFVATTWPIGFEIEPLEYFEGRMVVLLSCDENCGSYPQSGLVWDLLLWDARVKHVGIPNENGVVGWFNAGGTADELEKLSQFNAWDIDFSKEMSREIQMERVCSECESKLS